MGIRKQTKMTQREHELILTTHCLLVAIYNEECCFLVNVPALLREKREQLCQKSQLVCVL